MNKRRRRPSDPIQHEDENPTEEYYEDGNEAVEPMPEVDDTPDLDLFTNSEMLLPQDDNYMRAGTVIGRVSDKNGIPVG